MDENMKLGNLFKKELLSYLNMSSIKKLNKIKSKSLILIYFRIYKGKSNYLF